MVPSASCGLFFTRLFSLGYLKVSQHTEYSRNIRKILVCVKTFFQVPDDTICSSMVKEEEEEEEEERVAALYSCNYLFRDGNDCCGCTTCESPGTINIASPQ